MSGCSGNILTQYTHLIKWYTFRGVIIFLWSTENFFMDPTFRFLLQNHIHGNDSTTGYMLRNIVGNCTVRTYPLFHQNINVSSGYDTKYKQ